jgi:hypothetical protein
VKVDFRRGVVASEYEVQETIVVKIYGGEASTISLYRNSTFFLCDRKKVSVAKTLQKLADPPVHAACFGL